MQDDMDYTTLNPKAGSNKKPKINSSDANSLTLDVTNF